MLDRAIATALRPLARRIENILARAVVTAVEAGRLQVLQVDILAGETKDGVQHFEPAGFTSHPLPGAEGLVVFPDGVRTHAVAVVVTDRRHRPTDLKPGEAAVFCPADGLSQLRLERDGTVRVIGPAKVRVETPVLEVTGEVRDRCDGAGRTMASMRDVYDTHTHPDPDGDTGVPNQPM